MRTKVVFENPFGLPHTVCFYLDVVDGSRDRRKIIGFRRFRAGNDLEGECNLQIVIIIHAKILEGFSSSPGPSLDTFLSLPTLLEELQMRAARARKLSLTLSIYPGRARYTGWRFSFSREGIRS